MTAMCQRFVRRVAPMLAAGCLFQASGCALDGGQLAQGLLTTILNSLISSLVFGLFNVPTGGI